MADSTRRNALFLIFFVSGFTGLIYESLWSHYLKLFLGHAAYAQSLVLMIFMGGMALGAALASHISRHSANLLRSYGLAEISIGLLALAFHPLFTWLTDVSFTYAMPRLDSPTAIETYKWSMAALLLLPPSVLLGMTFPLMSGAVLRRFPGQAGGNLAMLYFANSIGAAIGVLAASFVLIARLGLPGTLTVSGIVNLGIGLAVLRLATVGERIPDEVAPAGALRNRRLMILLLAAAFVTGAASFIYEVSWIRMLSLVLGSTFHAFELMLSAFITGLALGSLAIRRHIDRVADPLAFAGIVQIAMGVLAVLTLPVYGMSFEWMGQLIQSLAKNNRGYTLFNLASHGIAFAVMLPATFMAGMTLPLFTHALIRNGHGERSIGLIYAANTLGAIVGVLFAVHIALPALGLKLSLASGALIDIMLGLLLLRHIGVSPKQWTMAFASILIPVLIIRIVTLDSLTLGSGVYRSGQPRMEHAETLFYRDGKTASIHVARVGSTVTIRTNGKSDAAIEMNPQLPASSDEITMVIAGALPLALRPDAKRVANIGFGSGLTTHTLLASPNIAEVSTVEIERAVVDGARAFMPNVERAYNDPRSHIYIEDAKTWFARHNGRFDIIVSEPSNPWVSGVASLFSDEFYERIGGHLTEGGLLVQWIQLYEFNTRLLASIIVALNHHFADYALYLTDDANVVIVATKAGQLPAPSRELFGLGPIAQDLGRIGINTLDDLALRRVGNAAMITPLLATLGAPANSDYYPYVELNAPRARFLNNDIREIQGLGTYPLPLIEMLDRKGTQWRADQVTPTDGWRARRVADALAARAALLGLPSTNQAAEKAMVWRRMLTDCSSTQSKAPAALHEIAITTLAHLDRAKLADLWQKPAWLPCAPSVIAPRLALYQAIAARDAKAMLAASRAALAESDRDLNWRRYALDAGLLAARSLAEEGAVELLWEQHGTALYPEGNMTPELVLLLSHKPTPR